MTFRQQALAQMRSQKTGSAGDDGNSVLCGHCGIYLMSAAQVYQPEVMANDGIVW
jgi:hypothetical protein